MKVLIDPDAIEETLIKCSIIHPGQSEVKLFTKCEILKYIDKNSYAKCANDILNGSNTYQHLQLTVLQKK